MLQHTFILRICRLWNMQIPTENPHTSTCGGSQSRMRRKSHHALKNNEKSFCTFEFLEGRQLFSASPVRTQASDIKIEQIPWNGKIVSVVDDSYYIRMNQTQTGRNALDYRHRSFRKTGYQKKLGSAFIHFPLPEQPSHRFNRGRKQPESLTPSQTL